MLTIKTRTSMCFEGEYTTPLNRLKASWLFADTPFGLSPPHRLYLIEQFYLRFSHRNLGTDYEQTFKNWVRGAVLASWERYAPLFASVNKVNLDNFDVNFFGEEREKTNEQRINKHSSKSSNDENTAAQDIKSGVLNKTADVKDETQGYQYNSSDDENWSSLADTITTDQLATDAPNSVSLTEGVLSGDKSGLLESWNDGYLTGAQRTNSKTGKDSISQDNKIAGGIDGRNSENFSQEATTSTDKANATSQKSGNLASKSNANELEDRFKKFEKRGRFGVDLSAAMMSYRQTMALVTNEWLDQFERFFLSIY